MWGADDVQLSYADRHDVGSATEAAAAAASLLRYGGWSSCFTLGWILLLIFLSYEVMKLAHFVDG